MEIEKDFNRNKQNSLFQNDFLTNKKRKLEKSDIDEPENLFKHYSENYSTPQVKKCIIEKEIYFQNGNTLSNRKPKIFDAKKQFISYEINILEV